MTNTRTARMMAMTLITLLIFFENPFCLPALSQSAPTKSGDVAIGGVEKSIDHQVSDRTTQSKNAINPPKEEAGGGIKETACPEGYPSIEDCLTGLGSPVSATLSGDGVNTTNCTLTLTNTNTGASTSADLTTVCASPKSLKPPQPKERAKTLTYVPVPVSPDVSRIIKNARKLERAGEYDGVSLPVERRQQTMTQLAIWLHLGGSDESSKDAINPASIKRDLLTRSGLKESALTKDERKNVNHRVDLMFEKVVLTEKPSTVEPRTPKKPEEPGEPVVPGQPKHPGEPGQPTNPGEPGERTTETYCVREYTTWHCTTEGYQDMTCIYSVTVACPGTIQRSTSIFEGPIIGGPPPLLCSWALEMVVVANPKAPGPLQAILELALKALVKTVGAAAPQIKAVKTAMDKLGAAGDLPDVTLVYVCTDNKGVTYGRTRVPVTGNDELLWAAKTNLLSGGDKAANDRDRQRIIDAKGRNLPANCCAPVAAPAVPPPVVPIPVPPGK